MITALKAIKLTGRMPTLENRHNATVKTSVFQGMQAIPAS